MPTLNFKGKAVIETHHYTLICCEKILGAADTRQEVEKDNVKRVRPMLVPFSLK